MGRARMHMTIGVIVNAEDEDEAKGNAASILDSLSGEGGPFDYYSMYDDIEETVEAAPGRGIYRVSSRTGKKWVDKLMRWTKEEFMDNLARIRKVMSNHDDKAIWNSSDMGIEDDMDMFRYRCHNLGAYTGPSIWLYHGGSGVRDEGTLHGILSDAENDPTDSLWIVLSDVHY